MTLTRLIMRLLRDSVELTFRGRHVEARQAREAAVRLRNELRQSRDAAKGRAAHEVNS